MTEDDYVPLPHVVRAVKNSDCRAPVIFVAEDGDPYPTLRALAKETNSSIWDFDLEKAKNTNNIMDYVEVGVKNGDWVYVTNCDVVDPFFFRDVGRIIYLLEPEPERFPRREFFRSFFCVKKPFDINGHRPPFPTLMMKNSIVSRIKEDDSKWSVQLPVNGPQYDLAMKKHERRRGEGRDSDSETDLDEDQQLSGMRFYRCAEFSKSVDKSPVATAKDTFWKALQEEDVETMSRLVRAAEVDPHKKLSNGMTPLQFAVCMQLPTAVNYLLSIGGDPNLPRESDKRPPLFMYVEDKAIAKALIDAGADLYAKYQGYRLDNHPETSSEIAAYAKLRRDNM